MTAYAFLLAVLIGAGLLALSILLALVIGKGIHAADVAEQHTDTLPIEGRETRWDVLL